MANPSRVVLSLAALICLPAMAEFTTVAEAYEVALTDFTAPASAHGVVAFKACSDCALEKVRVTPETRYLVNGRDVRLPEFRNALAGVTERDSAGVTVMHHLASDTVTWISTTL